jgi:hypothetical protein
MSRYLQRVKSIVAVGGMSGTPGAGMFVARAMLIDASKLTLSARVYRESMAPSAADLRDQLATLTH